ncbi:MAG TPA: nicotinamidase [Chloroflexi bacterium]|jgi:nicotinamidase/pyrazinamidase|nr:nicotinamidase [Chloroflexota bacterium]
MALQPNSALLVVDMQRDFMPGGALGVPEGDSIIPKVNAYIGQFAMAGAPILATRDWHPPETVHFQAQGGLWPPHCVQGTPGAEFHPGVKLPEGIIVLSKGMDPREDAYSAFHARALETGATLRDHLRALGIEHLYLSGLALDYCVKWTALGAIREVLGVTVLIDATRAVNLAPHDAEETIETLVRAGVQFETIETLWVTCKACEEFGVTPLETGASAAEEAIRSAEATVHGSEP